MSLVRFKIGSTQVLADLNETECALGILEALPIRSRARVWGQEVYFDTEVILPEENPQAHVPPGTVAYWLPGKAVCLFFGQTPASPVSVVGTMRGNPRDLAAVHAGDEVTVEAAGEVEASGGQGA
jgi:hypothetical protein